MSSACAARNAGKMTILKINEMQRNRWNTACMTEEMLRGRTYGLCEAMVLFSGQKKREKRIAAYGFMLQGRGRQRKGSDGR